MYLIHLEGQGDMDICLVTKDLFDWINMKRNCPKWFVDFVKNKVDEYDDDLPDLNTKEGSSPDNDRALDLSCFIPSYTLNLEDISNCNGCVGFNVMSDIFKYVAENNIKIEGEYHGYIY